MLSQMRGQLVKVTVFLQEAQDDEQTGFLTRVGFLVGDDDRYVYLGEPDLTIHVAIAHSKIVSIDLYEEEELDHSIPEGTSLN